MDFQPLLEQYKPLLKQHWIPLGLGCIGLIFFIYGLIASLGTSSQQENIVFEAASKDVKTQNSREKLVIDVAGAVVKPGVYKLVLDARVQDALVAAGGLSLEADREWVAKNLNLAAKLADGGKIYIPRSGESITSTTGTTSSGYPRGTLGTFDTRGTLNINSASQSQLESLSGVGPVTAQKIIDGRPYSSIDELLSKKIVGKSVWEKIKDKVTLY